MNVTYRPEIKKKVITTNSSIEIVPAKWTLHAQSKQTDDYAAIMGKKKEEKKNEM